MPGERACMCADAPLGERLRESRDAERCGPTQQTGGPNCEVGHMVHATTMAVSARGLDATDADEEARCRATEGVGEALCDVLPTMRWRGVAAVSAEGVGSTPLLVTKTRPRSAPLRPDKKKPGRRPREDELRRERV